MRNFRIHLILHCTEGDQDDTKRMFADKIFHKDVIEKKNVGIGSSSLLSTFQGFFDEAFVWWLITFKKFSSPAL